MKDVANWFSSEDFLLLMEKKVNRQIFFSENITYKDADTIKQFSQEYEGIIVTEPKGKGNSIENVAEFEGFTLVPVQNLPHSDIMSLGGTEKTNSNAKNISERR